MLGGAGDWIELAGKEAANIVYHIASTGIIIDKMPTQLVDQFSWVVTAINESDKSNKWTAIVTASHDGTAVADATKAKYGLSSILMQGAKIGGLGVSVSVSGQGAEQYMNLHVSAQAMTTFISYRLIKNVAGSKSVVFSETALASHATDGSVHLTPAQNTLIDGFSASLSSAQVNYLVGVTSPIQEQLNSKTKATSVTLIGDVIGTAIFDGQGECRISAVLQGDITSTKTFTGAVTCNYAEAGSYVIANVTGATTLTITGVPDTIRAYGMTFELTNAGSNITWPASVSWLGSAPTLRATGITIVTLITRNGGVTWLGSAA
jgi:hypothetical protein